MGGMACGSSMIRECSRQVATTTHLLLSYCALSRPHHWHRSWLMTSLYSCFQSLQSSLTSHEHSVVWHRLRRGWMCSVDGTHRRLATARTDLKASGELAWTMLPLTLFRAIIVRGKKDCLYCSVLQLGIVRQWSRLRDCLWTGFWTM